MSIALLGMMRSLLFASEVLQAGPGLRRNNTNSSGRENIREAARNRSPCYDPSSNGVS